MIHGWMRPNDNHHACCMSAYLCLSTYVCLPLSIYLYLSVTIFILLYSLSCMRPTGSDASIISYGGSKAGKSFTMSGFGQHVGVFYRSILKVTTTTTTTTSTTTTVYMHASEQHLL